MDLAKPIRDPGTLAYQPPPMPPLAIEWQAFLTNCPWDWFLTITFRDMVPMHRQESVMHAVGKTIMASHQIRLLYLVSEAHSSQTLHLHGLHRSAVGPKHLKFEQKLLWHTLFDAFGRSKVEIPRGRTAIAGYVTKYCLKSGGYYEIFGPSPGIGGVYGDRQR